MHCNNNSNRSSLAFKFCNPPRYLQDHSSMVYNTSIEPNDNKEKDLPLNHLGMYENKSCYQEVPNPCNPCKPAYKGTNPLLMSAMRGQILLLDRPEFIGSLPVGDVEHDQIYTKEISKYGGRYKSYDDMNNGQIQYYVSGGISNAYFKPNFVTPAIVSHTLVKDPMDVYRPEYNRQSLKPYSFSSCDDNDCLSFSHDTLEFRQELMEKQMRPQNEKKWSARWF